jgi:hypothetical protein
MDDSETSSKEFKQHGGPLEVLQLWINLPARLKMTDPRYTGLQSDAIPVFEEDEGRVSIQLVSGVWHGRQGAFTPLLEVTAMLLRLQQHGRVELTIPLAHNVFFYVVRGSVQVSGRTVDEHHLADFLHDDEQLEIRATRDSMVLLCHALPIGEPVVSHGPFVMNTQEEIVQAIVDYQAGLFNA